MIYHYNCPSCQRLIAVEHTADAVVCERCQSTAGRVWGFHVSSSMKEHFNHAVRDYVSNQRDFEDKLKMAAEKNSIATGIDHEYVPLTPAEMMDHEHLKVDVGAGNEHTKRVAERTR